MDKRSSDMIWKILVIVFTVLVIHFSETNASITDKRMKLIIDTDAGGDDAVAILLALKAREELQVIAITCVYGNTDQAKVETNVLKILTVADRHNIPVYRGAKKPLLRNFTAGDYFGKDGLGDFEFGREILGNVDNSKHSALAMIELANRYAGDINILTLGPLTNVALAASLDPNFTQNVNKFYVMGGTVEESNEGVEAEFNFSLDPESVGIFLNSTMRSKALLSPWDVVVKNKISKIWRKETLGKLNSAAMKFLNNVENLVLENSTDWYPADSVAVATMIWPDIITEATAAKMTVRTCGDFKGSIIVERNAEESEKNVEIVRDFDITAFKDKLLRYLA